jgi:hypothetical protein
MRDLMTRTRTPPPGLACALLAALLAALLLFAPAPVAAQRDCGGEFARCMGVVTNVDGVFDPAACVVEYLDCVVDFIVCG